MTIYIDAKLAEKNIDADVAPVIHAHWVEKEDCSVITDIPWSMCSACGEYSPKLLYCAFCGAKMDEE